MGQLVRDFDGFLGGGHIGHKRGAGQNARGVRLGDAFIDAPAKSEIVGIYYQLSVHKRKSSSISHSKADWLKFTPV
jgi:hypothetical protein